jgi:hypothetical protein
MEKLLSYLIVMALALLAVALSYRIKFLHKLVFGRGSAMLNHAAEIHAGGAKA